jgi:molecular chaperone IbpA
MRFDLSPLYRSTVGFDSLASMLDQLSNFDNEADTYPPYNIERLAENEYRITMAVAGFGKQDVKIKIEVKENTLSIQGEKKEAEKRVPTPRHRIPSLRASRLSLDAPHDSDRRDSSDSRTLRSSSREWRYTKASSA